MSCKAFLLAGLLGIGLMPAAYAQTNNEPKKAGEPQATVGDRPMTAKIFEVKHRHPRDLVQTVSLLGSNAFNAEISFNTELKTISVRDFPENIAVIEEALKRLDVPAPPKPSMPTPISLEFQLHLIAASMTSGEKTAFLKSTAGEKTDFPKSIESVLPQLQASLKFTNYRYITTALHRVNNEGKLEASGVNSSLFPMPAGILNTSEHPAFSQYSANHLMLITDAAGKEFVHIRAFKFGVQVPIKMLPNVQYKDIGLVTDLTLREGELAVVGTANAGAADEAIIVVVSVKKLK